MNTPMLRTLLCLLALAATAADRPNILVIVGDDMG